MNKVSDFEKNGRFIWQMAFVGAVMFGLFWLADRVVWVGFVITIGLAFVIGLTLLVGACAAGWAMIAPIIRLVKRRRE